jgi:hypothetical protein
MFFQRKPSTKQKRGFFDMAQINEQNSYLSPLEKSWWFIINWVVPGLIFFALILLGLHYYCSAIADNQIF